MAARYSSRSMLMGGAGSPKCVESSVSRIGSGSGMLAARAMRTMSGSP